MQLVDTPRVQHYFLGLSEVCERNASPMQEACNAGEEAASMEKALGIRVVRHITKKPAGDAVDLEKHFR